MSEQSAAVAVEKAPQPFRRHKFKPAGVSEERIDSGEKLKGLSLNVLLLSGEGEVLRASIAWARRFAPDTVLFRGRAYRYFSNSHEEGPDAHWLTPGRIAVYREETAVEIIE